MLRPEFVEQYGGDRGSMFMGQKIAELSREELLAVVNCFAEKAFGGGQKQVAEQPVLRLVR